MTLPDTVQCWQNISNSFTVQWSYWGITWKTTFSPHEPCAYILLHHSMEVCLDMEGWKEVGGEGEW